jgi:hypothetical protein
MCIGPNVRYPYFVIFERKFNFFSRFSKNIEISNFTKIHPVRAEFYRLERWRDGWMDGRTDMTKLIVAFCYFANVTKTYTPVSARSKEAYSPML